MRPHAALLLLLLLLGGFVVFERASRFAPGPDAEVLALTTEPVRVFLDFSPSHAEIEDGVIAALERAAEAELQPEIADELASLADDGGWVTQLAATSVERLETDAAALAFSSTFTRGTGDVVTIIAVTVEILPRGRQDGISRAHEDGHASINNGIVERCSRAIVAYEVADGKSGDALVSAINDHIGLLESQAHSQYHLAVSAGVFGSHSRAAQRALETIERGGCVAYAA